MKAVSEVKGKSKRHLFWHTPSLGSVIGSYIVGVMLAARQHYGMPYPISYTNNPGPDLVWAGPCSEKNVGPLLIYEYRPTEFTRHAVTWANRCASMLARLCVNYQLATLDLTLYDASAPHKIVIFLLFQLFPACCYVSKIAGPVVGAPFLWGPLFGRTCWTCLNPPLSAAICL